MQDEPRAKNETPGTSARMRRALLDIKDRFVVVEDALTLNPVRTPEF